MAAKGFAGRTSYSEGRVFKFVRKQAVLTDTFRDLHIPPNNLGSCFTLSQYGFVPLSIQLIFCTEEPRLVIYNVNQL